MLIFCIFICLSKIPFIRFFLLIFDFNILQYCILSSYQGDSGGPMHRQLDSAEDSSSVLEVIGEYNRYYKKSTHMQYSTRSVEYLDSHK